MIKYKVTLEELINLYISHLRNWLRESLMESRGFPPTLVMSLVDEHVLINGGDLSNRKKWSKQYKEYQANLVQARRAVVEFEKVAFPNVKCYSQGGRRFSSKVKSSFHIDSSKLQRKTNFKHKLLYYFKILQNNEIIVFVCSIKCRFIVYSIV